MVLPGDLCQLLARVSEAAKASADDSNLSSYFEEERKERRTTIARSIHQRGNVFTRKSSMLSSVNVYYNNRHYCNCQEENSAVCEVGHFGSTAPNDFVVFTSEKRVEKLRYMQRAAEGRAFRTGNRLIPSASQPTHHKTTGGTAF